MPWRLAPVFNLHPVQLPVEPPLVMDTVSDTKMYAPMATLLLFCNSKLTYKQSSQLGLSSLRQRACLSVSVQWYTLKIVSFICNTVEAGISAETGIAIGSVWSGTMHKGNSAKLCFSYPNFVLATSKLFHQAFPPKVDLLGWGLRKETLGLWTTA